VRENATASLSPPVRERVVRRRRLPPIGLRQTSTRLRRPVQGNDDIAGGRHDYAGLRLSAEDLPVRLSATMS
jgi:hypothetical protein